jgi:hypothetical protein
MRKKEEDITQQLYQQVNLSNSIKTHTNLAQCNKIQKEIHHYNKKLYHKNWMNGQHTANK